MTTCKTSAKLVGKWLFLAIPSYVTYFQFLGQNLEMATSQLVLTRGQKYLCSGLGSARNVKKKLHFFPSLRLGTPSLKEQWAVENQLSVMKYYFGFIILTRSAPIPESCYASGVKYWSFGPRASIVEAVLRKTLLLLFLLFNFCQILSAFNRFVQCEYIFMSLSNKAICEHSPQDREPMLNKPISWLF